MAELVNLRLEHSMQELEEMERVKLFTHSEIKKITKKRMRHEYKLRRAGKEKEYFLNYIEYEMCLLRLIEKRRERLNIIAKKDEIDFAIAKKIKRLFKVVKSRYRVDEKLWLDEVEFCKKMKWFDSIKRLHNDMLLRHAQKPALWVAVAKWQMEHDQSPEDARDTLRRGVERNCSNEMLWREYYRTELILTDIVRKYRDMKNSSNAKDMEVDEDDSIINGRNVDAVYDQAIGAINVPAIIAINQTYRQTGVDYALSFIQICMDFDFGNRHIEHILMEVEKRFPDEAAFQDALARKPLMYVQERIEKGKLVGIKKKDVVKEINSEIRNSFDKAVEKYPSESMWYFYVDYALGVLETSRDKNKPNAQSFAFEVMERAASFDLLSKSHCQKWVELLLEMSHEERVLSESLYLAQKWKSASLWHKSLELHIQNMRNENEISALLNEALDSVDEKGAKTLWFLGINWLSIQNPNKLIDLFEKGVKKHSKISITLKEMYLDTIASLEGIDAARAIYKRFKTEGKQSYIVVKKIISLENGQIEPSIENIRKYYEDAVREFGATNANLWLDYIKFENSKGDPFQSSFLTNRAKRYLEAGSVAEFEERSLEIHSQKQ